MSETTQYLILRRTNDGSWQEVGSVAAEPRARRLSVLEQYLGPNPSTTKAGTYVAVRVSEWKPEPVEVEQTSTVRFVGFGEREEPAPDGEDDGA